MSQKKKPVSARQAEFRSNPFNSLKGFSASGQPSERPATKPVQEPKQPDPGPESFADEMLLLGVTPLGAEDAEADDERLEKAAPPLAEPAAPPPLSEQEQFLAAVGQLDVRFHDQIPTASEPRNASARRMRQLKQGKLIPEAELDLHGLQRAEVAQRLTFFLQDASYQGWRTVLVITGKGLHSEDGQAVLRTEVERFLQGPGKRWVAEWGRAPRQHGGAGALVLFLRQRRAD